MFDYPGEYYVKGDGEPITKVRMEEEEAGYDVVQGSSQCCTFTPCGKFTLENHDVDSECGDYVITSIQHSATEASYDASAGGPRLQQLLHLHPAPRSPSGPRG